MYFLLRQIPLVRLLIPFAVGIILGIYSTYSISELKIFAVISSLIFINCIIHLFLSSYNLRWLFGLFLSLSLLMFGFTFSIIRKAVNQQDYFEKIADVDSYLVVKIIETPKEKIKSLKAEAEVKRIVNDNTSNEVSGKVQLYFSKKDNLKIQYGDWLLFKKKKLNSIESPKNPYEFDYKQFLSFKQIHHQTYLSKKDFVMIKNDAEYIFMHQIVKLNRYFNNVLKQNIPNKKSFAIASSLLIGNREYLDFELIKAYSSSGAMHVLAVSGLHIGILFFIVDKILFFLDRNKWQGRLVKTFITIILIWLYATVTGFSPSVQRAAIMFSLIAFGQNIRRSYNIYNVLAGAAIVQLLVNPFTIMEVGFQLSYAAVLGIVMFQRFFYDFIFIRKLSAKHLIWIDKSSGFLKLKFRKLSFENIIYNLKYWKNVTLDFFRQITCVSIAAQLITFPIGLLYFHQFPLYFFISNLVVIPAAFCIMLIGVCMLVLSPVPTVSFALGKILNVGISFMNKSVFLVEQLPFSLIQGLSISVLESWMLYTLIFLFFAFIHTFNRKLILVGLVISVLFMLSITIENYSQWNQKQFVVYNTPGATYAYDFISGKKNLLLASKSLTDNYSQMQFHIMHNWWERDVNQHFVKEYQPGFYFANSNEIIQQRNYFLFADKKIAIINKKLPEIDMEKKLKVDYVILSRTPKLKIEDIKRLYEFEWLIADGSNSFKQINKWKKYADIDNTPFWNVREKGAFTYNFTKKI